MKQDSILLSVLIIWSVLSLGENARAAGPMLEPGLSSRIDLLYQFASFNRPLPDDDEPDTTDLAFPNNRTMLRLRKRFSSRDVIVLKYDMREYTLRENSYRRYVDPITHEFEHRVKIGVGYKLNTRFNPFGYYEYFSPFNGDAGHTVIGGTRISLSSIMMIEPTYALSMFNGQINHFLLIRWHQIITPTLFIMAKNSYSFADSDPNALRNNAFETYIGLRAAKYTAIHIGYRHYYNFEKINSNSMWIQYGQQLSDYFTLWNRLRGYLRSATAPDSSMYRSYSIEFRLMRKPLSMSGIGKNLSVSVYNIFFLNNDKTKADAIGLEISHTFPLRIKKEP